MIAELAFSVLLSLLGFIQPCSFGINSIFLSYLREMKMGERVIRTLELLAVRTAFFAFLGIIAGYAGSALEFTESVVIYPYLLLGVVFLISRLKPLPVPNINPLKLVGKENDPSLPLAVNFGLNIPSCVLPLLLAVLLKALYLGDTFLGFASLLVFSLALSLPLILISAKNGTAMKALSRTVGVAPVMAGVSLIAFAVVRLI